MRLWRDIAGEVTKALVALALIFLSFAHQPVDVAQANGDAFSLSVADLSFCGGGPDGDGDGNHSPCHACRAGIADLPPAPCVAEPAYVGFITADFVARDDVVFDQTVYSSKNSRAPPASV